MIVVRFSTRYNGGLSLFCYFSIVSRAHSTSNPMSTVGFPAAVKVSRAWNWRLAFIYTEVKIACSCTSPPPPINRIRTSLSTDVSVPSPWRILYKSSAIEAPYLCEKSSGTFFKIKCESDKYLLRKTLIKQAFSISYISIFDPSGLSSSVETLLF
jgi:hypothetical protein